MEREAHLANHLRPSWRQAILCYIPILLVALFVTALLTPAPLGILLGMPFPIGLTLIGEEAARLACLGHGA